MVPEHKFLSTDFHKEKIANNEIASTKNIPQSHRVINLAIKKNHRQKTTWNSLIGKAMSGLASGVWSYEKQFTTMKIASQTDNRQFW